ncbi:hypothetical protein EMCG_04841 [[Emmonsia] crescens]|uniref:Uncharacterized protein n=1 Tax=[Emmonsia] crescens TaxID=73230 RepID=A0A0G2HQV5_9EURO|nr:hypothetical protein EMCG_04841 [Emmonsia crescens UAMH 3008]
MDSPPSDDLRDSRDLSLKLEDIERFRKGPASINPFSDLNLEFIGISCDLENLRPIISPLTQKQSLKVLQIRQSSSDVRYFRRRGFLPRRIARFPISPHSDVENDLDITDSDTSIIEDSNKPLTEGNLFPRTTPHLHDFAQWAFGPRGFQSLQTLVLGDFSCEGLYSV